MMFDPSMMIPQEDLAELLSSASISLRFGGNSFLLGIAAYVLLSLGLYSIAKRRGIHNPWMAWVPVLNAWILGSIADQYRYVTKGQVCNRRKALIVLEILRMVATIAVGVALGLAVFQVITNASRFEMLQKHQVIQEVLKTLLPMLAALGVLTVVALVKLIVTAVTYCDLFASCDPKNKVLFVVLGLLIGILMPVFVFACREKDLGMPARKAAPPAAEAAAEEAQGNFWENSEE